MRLLISLCNASHFNSQFSLGIVDTAGGESRLVDCTAFVDLKQDGGITGLCQTDRGLAVAVQSVTPRVAMLDESFKPVWSASDPRLGNVQSLIFHAGRLFAMSAGQNKILEIDPKSGAVSLFWEYEGAESASLHVNSLAFHDGKAVVCSHRLPPEADQASKSGGCWRLDDLQVLIAGLKAPHSLTAVDGALVCLSSGDGRVGAWRDGKVAWAEVTGYLRGMLLAGEETFLGSSALPFVSRKAQEFKRSPDFKTMVGNPAYMSSLVVCDRAFRETRRIPTTFLGFEIYEVIKDPGTPSELIASHSPSVRMQTLQRLTVTLREQVQALRQPEEAEG